VTGIDEAAALTFQGEFPADGLIPAPPGDLDGDGLPDLAFGAFASDAGGTDRGAVYVWWGSDI
jgi:hypothetical protein